MADIKYQIFVSSTYKDLIPERDVAIEAILGLGYLPASMERFSASSNNQMNYIKKIIDNCDYYLLIIGDRYGTIDEESGISYTEQEYDYAISKRIPVLAFWKGKVEKADNLQELQRFTKKVQEGRLCKSWDTITDLQSVIYPSLIYETRENPQQGWTRGGGEDNTELLKEVNGLRKDKEALQNQIGELQAELQKHTCTQVENLAEMDEEFKIEDEYGNTRSISWNEIFSQIAPKLGVVKEYSDFKTYLKNEYYYINDDYTQTIKLQFEAQGLIELMQGTLSNGALVECMRLTTKGKQYLMQIKTVKTKKEEVTS